MEKNGDPYRGSGFIARAKHDGTPWVVTCRHNVDPNDGIVVREITTANGNVVIPGPPIMSERHDLCFMPLMGDIDFPVFRLTGATGMFDEVYKRGPLGRRPHAQDDDRENDENLPDEQFCGGHEAGSDSRAAACGTRWSQVASGQETWVIPPVVPQCPRRPYCLRRRE